MTRASSEDPAAGPSSKKASEVSSGRGRHLRADRRASLPVDYLPVGFKPARRGGVNWAEPRGPGGRGGGGDPRGSAWFGKGSGSGSERLSL